MALYFQFFGTLKAYSKRQEIFLSHNQSSWLLIYLAYKKNWVSRQEIINLFWPESDDEDGRNRLRVLLHRTQDLDIAQNLEIKRFHLRFDVNSDVRNFVDFCHNKDFVSAIEIYNGDFLSDVGFKNSNFDHWCQNERNYLKALWQKMLNDQIFVCKSQNKYAEAFNLSEKLYNSDQINEEFLQTYLSLSQFSNNESKVIETYQHFRQKIFDEFNLKPLPSTIELINSIKNKQRIKDPPFVKTEFLETKLLIGREKELDLLAKSDKSLILITGEPGIGKTSLLQTAFPNANWLFCREEMREISYFPVIEFLKKHYQQVKKYGSDLSWLMPDIFPQINSYSLDIEELKTRLFSVLSACIIEILADDPLLIDDLQWIDDLSLQLIFYILNTYNTKIYLTLRNDDISKNINNYLSAYSNKNVVELKELSESEINTLIAQFVTNDHVSTEIVTVLHRQSGGNPLFANQLLRKMAENEILINNQNGLHFDLDRYKQISSINLESIIIKRISSLSPLAKKAVEICSLIDVDFTPGMIGLIMDLGEWQINDIMLEINSKGIVDNYKFRHEFIKNTIANSLDDWQKRFIHQKIAEKLDGRLPDFVLANHWLNANDLDKATDKYLLGFELSYMNLEQQTTLDIYNLIVENTKSAYKIAKAKMILASFYYSIGDFSKIELMSPLKLSLKVIDPTIYVCHLYICTIYLRLAGKINQLHQILEEWLARFDSNGDYFNIKIASLYTEILLIFNKPLKVLQFWQNISDVFVKSSDNFSEINYQYLYFSAISHSLLENYQQSVDLIEDCFANYFDLIDNYGRIDLFVTKIRLLRLAYIDDGAMTVTKFALQYIENNILVSSIDLSALYLEACLVHLRHNMYAQALVLCQKISDRAFDIPAQKAYILVVLAQIYAGLKQKNPCQSHLEQALEVIQTLEIDVPLVQSAVLLNTVRYGNNNQFDRAIKIAKCLNNQNWPTDSWDKLQKEILIRLQKPQ